MVEYLTPEMLDILMNITKDERSNLEEPKQRGKGYVIPDINKKSYITLNYAYWICKYLKSKMSTGGLLRIQDTIRALDNTDWVFHSYNHLIFSTNRTLSNALLKSKAKYRDPENDEARLEMLDEQADYLRRATLWVIGELEGLQEVGLTASEQASIKKVKRS